jgi:hypothetical protein
MTRRSFLVAVSALVIGPRAPAPVMGVLRRAEVTFPFNALERAPFEVTTYQVLVPLADAVGLTVAELVRE